MHNTAIVISLLSLGLLIILLVLMGLKMNSNNNMQSNPNHPLNANMQSQHTDPTGRPLLLPYSVLRHPQLLYPSRPMPSIFGKCL